MLAPFRRIVTGHDAAGVARVLSDDPATAGVERGAGQVTRVIWSTDETPAALPLGVDVPEMGGRNSFPSGSGTRFNIIDFPPDNVVRMHRTESIDYVIVLAGEIDMDLDEGTVRMKAGDVMIQRATNHAWVNRSAAPARVAFVLVAAQPLGISPETTRG